MRHSRHEVPTSFPGLSAVARTALCAFCLLLLRPASQALGQEEERVRTAIVQADAAKVKIGKEVVAVVTKGRQLTVIKTKGTWIGVKWVSSTGELKRGWVLKSKVRFEESASTPTTGVGSIPPSQALSALTSRFVKGDNEDRKKIYAALTESRRADDAVRLMARDAVEMLSAFFETLKTEGRERILKEFYRSDYIENNKGEDSTYEMQKEHEKYSADYSGVWPEHVFLFSTGLCVGLKPKNRKVLDIMKVETKDKYGNPSWLKNGPYFVVTPEGGRWKVLAIQKMAYADNMSTMLRRQEQEDKR